MAERLDGCAFHTVRTLGCVMCDDIATGAIEFVSATTDDEGREVREFRPPAPVIDIGPVQRLRRAKERSTGVDLFVVAAHVPRMRRELGPLVMIPKDLLVHLERLIETVATVHGQEERLNDVYGAMGRAPEVDFSGCEAVGVGGYHSLGYGDEGGYCNWCGKGSPVKESKDG